MNDSVKEAVKALISQFMMTIEGNDAYALRYHYLCLIFKLSGKDLKDYLIINEADLYNLQYNYEHFIKIGGVNVNKLRLTDFEKKEITAYDLEDRLQRILNKMFLALEVILKDYGGFNLGFK